MYEVYYPLPVSTARAACISVGFESEILVDLAFAQHAMLGLKKKETGP